MTAEIAKRIWRNFEVSFMTLGLSVFDRRRISPGAKNRRGREGQRPRFCHNGSMQIQLPNDARIEEKQDGLWLIVPNAAFKLHGGAIADKALRSWFDKASSPVVDESA